MQVSPRRWCRLTRDAERCKGFSRGVPYLLARLVRRPQVALTMDTITSGTWARVRLHPAPPSPSPGTVGCRVRRARGPAQHGGRVSAQNRPRLSPRRTAKDERLQPESRPQLGRPGATCTETARSGPPSVVAASPRLAPRARTASTARSAGVCGALVRRAPRRPLGSPILRAPTVRASYRASTATPEDG